MTPLVIANAILGIMEFLCLTGCQWYFMSQNGRADFSKERLVCTWICPVSDWTVCSQCRGNRGDGVCCRPAPYPGGGLVPVYQNGWSGHFKSVSEFLPGACSNRSQSCGFYSVCRHGMGCLSGSGYRAWGKDAGVFAFDKAVPFGTVPKSRCRHCVRR